MEKTKQELMTLALVGNPNAGKTSIFNLLTGLHQKTGNFPGVTVDKKQGTLIFSDNSTAQLIDFPGTYSLYPNSSDEKIVVQTFANPDDEHYPDAFVYVADITKLDKHLLLFSQIKDIGLPVILVLNMADIAEKNSCQVDSSKLSARLDCPVVLTSGRTQLGINELKTAIAAIQKETTSISKKPFRALSSIEKEIAKKVNVIFPKTNEYQALLIAHHHDWFPFVTQIQKEYIATIVNKENFISLRMQVEETMQRFNIFTNAIRGIICHENEKTSDLTQKIDNVLTHKVFGPLIFLAVMFSVFQAIFVWASYPMDLIDATFGFIGEQLKATLPAGWFSDMLTDGLLAGLGGILIFIPQIVILFFLISLMEEVGYMARVVYLFDSIMQKFGLSGRSLIALISSSACAIPAVMSTRTIGNWKERLITIMVTPFISCAARIPVYAVLIGFAFPSKVVMGIFNLQGLAFMGLYLLGICAALIFAILFKIFLKSSESSFLILELPEYKRPMLRNVGINVWSKVKSFIVEAGKIILVISLVLWGMSNFGPAGEMENATKDAISFAQEKSFSASATKNLIAAKKMEASYAGHLGKIIEPVVKPLGFDWKIGIALLTSFAAREVFVGTMATIYSIGGDADEFSVREQMAKERNPETGELVYNTATSISLLVFYVFAMMCMGTLAVVKRETNSWKWPIFQFVFMTGLAYLSSFLVFQWLS